MEHSYLSYYWFFLWALIRDDVNPITLPDDGIQWQTIEPQNLLTSHAEYRELLDIVEQHLKLWHPPQNVGVSQEANDAWNKEIERICQKNLAVYPQFIKTRQEQVEIEFIQKYLNVKKCLNGSDPAILTTLVRLNRLPLCTDYSCSGHVDPVTGQLHRKKFCVFGFHRDAALWRYLPKEVYAILRGLPKAVQDYFTSMFGQKFPPVMLIENSLGSHGSLSFLGGLKKDEGYAYVVDFRAKEFETYSPYLLLQSVWQAIWMYLNTFLGDLPLPGELTIQTNFDKAIRREVPHCRHMTKTERREQGRAIARSVAQTRST